ncbi:MAG: VanW family protein [Clostridia bacterium]|nr:VanW family protein [Clostridia bacterium]
MPFYNLHPSNVILRAEFCTDFSSSSIERKHNIALACKSIDNYFLDVGGEFSFNRVVGQRTEKRGYKTAKIIFNGEFVDGVGGGVCQVSTTLYNAVLLSNLKITEYHPHSLAVSYVPASFDAMVNSNTADLRFINNTFNPVIIRAKAQNNKLKIQIWGEKLDVQVSTKSVITGTVLPPPHLEIVDEKGEFPDLYQGESKFTRYQKNGVKSEGYVLIKQNGKIIERKKIRTDTYSAIQGILVHGTTPRPTPSNEDSLQKTCSPFCAQ